MSLRTSAARYARALLDVAMQESDPEKIERQLASFVQTIETNAQLKGVLVNPSIPTMARRQIVANLAERAALDRPLAKLLVMLADRGRLELLPDLLHVYRERFLATSNVVKGSLRSAAPLAPHKVQALERSLSQATGKHVQLDTAVDPSLIGGVVAQIGSTVYDGSVRTQLQRLKQQLIETT